MWTAWRSAFGASWAGYNIAYFEQSRHAAKNLPEATDPTSARPFSGPATEVPWVGTPVSGGKLFKLNKQHYGGPSYVAVAVLGHWVVSVEMSVRQPDAARWAANGVADTVANMRASGVVD